MGDKDKEFKPEEENVKNLNKDKEFKAEGFEISNKEDKESNPKDEDFEILEEDIEKVQDLIDIGVFQLQPIPAELYSVYLEGPFKECIDCGCSLSSPGQFYEIQKVYKGKEVIFEYALCIKCGKILLKEYSRHSKAAMQKFFMEHYSPFSLPKHCNICQSDQSKSKEYILTAFCSGPNVAGPVVTFCGQCMENVEKLLSKKTRDIQGEFIEKKFPGIPVEFSPRPIMIS